MHAEPAAGPYLCELFENERCQPFRGWGHTWPGHFLPTDRVGHWSNRDGGPGGKASMSFRSVAPKLPPARHADLALTASVQHEAGLELHLRAAALAGRGESAPASVQKACLGID